ncbi:hypothetical protein UFOVP411_12 [uncultured Caudovirales phage]|uniref:Uncharacterized protein n=1 Tax=uncultured Caudovirales phage TaxID=2100421 RepID=A0A6J5M457_9CAUD|nr:hypothetical protein UFOVP411_12 [uncultured Caudovirales phage]
MFYFKDKNTGAVVSFESPYDAEGVRRQREYAEIGAEEFEAIKADFASRSAAIEAPAEPAAADEPAEEVEVVVAPAKPAKAPAKPKARRKSR